MYEKKSKGWRKHLDFTVLDIICLQLAFILAYNIRFGTGNPYKDAKYMNLAIVYLLVDFMVVIIFDSFKNVLRRGYYKEFTAMVSHVCLVEGLALLYLFTTQSGVMYSRIFFYIMIPLYALFTYIARLLWKNELKSGKLRRSNRSLLIIAPQEKLGECVDSICERNYPAYCSISAAALDAPMKDQRVHDIPVVADYDGIASYVCREWVDEVFLLLDHTKDEHAELVEKLRQTGVVMHIAVAKTKSFAAGRRQHVEQMGDYAVLTTSLNYATTKQLFLKRLIDIAGSLAGCLVTLVLLIFIGPLIYMNSPGPVFFSQERIGRNGRKFKMYKFRTMYPDAETRKEELLAQNRIEGGMMFKLDYDPRIIGNRRLPDGRIKKGIGSFLRETSLDEFPQMFNILRGDMSLVGTRPPTVDEWEKYELHHRARLAFRPGLTGLWQVSGRSNITDFEEIVRLDTEYIDAWSIGLDIKILLKTVGVVLESEGAL